MASDVFLLDIGGFVGGQVVENVLAFENQSSSLGSPDQDAKSLIDSFKASAQAIWLSCLSNDYTLNGYRAIRVNNGGGGGAWEEPIAEAGTVGALSVTSGAGAVITASYYNSGGAPARWRTTRLFMPGIPDGQIQGNQIMAPLNGNLGDLIDVLNSTMGVGAPQFLYCAWSRKQKVAYNLNNFNVSALIGSQRRRLRPAL